MQPDIEWEYTTENCVEGYHCGSTSIMVYRAIAEGGNGVWQERVGGIPEEQANCYAVTAYTHGSPKTLIRYEDEEDAREFAALCVDYLSERGHVEMSVSEIQHGPGGQREWEPDYVESEVDPEEALSRMVGYHAGAVSIWSED